MLFIGLAGHSSERPIMNRLIQLGAARGRMDAVPSWDVASPAIVVLSGTGQPGETHWPGLHFAIAVDARLDADGPAAEVARQVDVLWADRLVPFEANLRAGRRAPRRQYALLVDPDPTWAEQAARLAPPDMLAWLHSPFNDPWTHNDLRP
jgi:hypothetical protein